MIDIWIVWTLCRNSIESGPEMCLTQHIEASGPNMYRVRQGYIAIMFVTVIMICLILAG